jgi:hypothetical protein
VNLKIYRNGEEVEEGRRKGMKLELYCYIPQGDSKEVSSPFLPSALSRFIS